MDYKQISCSLYDRLESLAITKQEVELTILNGDGQDPILLSGIIINIFSDSSAEYLIISEQKVRLDKIVAIKEL